VLLKSLIGNPVKIGREVISLAHPLIGINATVPSSGMGRLAKAPGEPEDLPVT